MDSDVAPERGLSSSMALYTDEGHSEGVGGRAFAPGAPSIRMSHYRGRGRGGGSLGPAPAELPRGAATALGPMVFSSRPSSVF